MSADPLLDWYETVRRPLPWRFTRDPWAILVSEVMLQQTQAARVVPHYERFLARFPSPRRAGGGARRRGDRRLERARLQPPRARAAGRGARGGRAGLAAARAAGGAARRRPVHGRGGRLVRLGRADGGGRHQRPARDRAPRRRAADPARAGAARGRARAGGPGGGLEPGDDGARRDGLPAAPAAVRGVPAAGGLRRPGGGDAAAAAARRALRGQRPLGARARCSRRSWPASTPPELAPERRERALAGLARDGLVVRGRGRRRPRLP